MRAAVTRLVSVAVVLGVLSGAGGCADPERSVRSSGAGPPLVVADPPPPARYLADVADLEQHAELAADGVEPFATAVDELVAFAEAALDESPDPARVIDIDGTEHAFVDDSATAYGLALASVVTGRRDFAEQARAFIGAWVQGSERAEGTCPHDGSCQTSLIVGRAAPGFVFAADLLEATGSLPDDDREALRRWLREVILPSGSERPNNWGDAGNFMRVVVGDYLGDDEVVAAALDSWRDFLDLVERDGHIPEEVRRGRSGLMYSQEALAYKVAVAELAARRGVDLWSYRGAGGATLRDAVDLVARSLEDPSGWRWYDGDVRVPSPNPLWELVHRRFGDGASLAQVRRGRPFSAGGHSAIRWTTLTHGVADR